ncbi:MAG: hypothetical protein NVV72_10120 [Asticcacaulis sp.]|nr:hypothetical protein [Asticcacaulis sp.]
MPLAVKHISHDEPDAHDEAALTTEERLTQFVRNEIDRALRDVDRRKRLAEAELEQRARRASKRIVTSGHRLERSLRHKTAPGLPVAMGLAIIGAAWFLTRDSRS